MLAVRKRHGSFAPAAALLLLLLGVGPIACAGPASPRSYRMADVKPPVDLADPAFAPLRKRYGPFFVRVKNVRNAPSADTRGLASDLEAKPVAERNYKALNALALAYFYLYGQRARWPGGAEKFFGSTFPASLLALPWSAYKVRRDPELRDAILAFFEDLVRREGMVRGTNARLLASNLGALELREKDPGRRERLRALGETLRERIFGSDS